MHKLCRINLAQSGRLAKQIKAFCNKVKKQYNAKVYLFGSAVRGELSEGSDIDIIAVGDFKASFKERIGELLDMTDLPIEPICYTPAEFAKMKKQQNRFITHVLKEAKLIC